MKVVIGADHGGYKLKQKIIQFLKTKGIKYKDVGTYSESSVDYPIYAEKVGREVSARRASRGILICKSGTGMSIAVNKIKGVRAAVCNSVRAARLSREHNDANVLTLGADFVNVNLAKKILNTWLNTKFAAGRHKRRVRQINKLESKS
ncbi:MAG: ribose 5-phosphate isomerase B [Candidatus Omnitrophota bacterium]